VFLMGGPGIPGSVLAPIPPYFDLFDRLSEKADVVVLDQRGLGESVPKVDCPPPLERVSPSLFESKAEAAGCLRGRHAWLRRALAANTRSNPRISPIEQVADDVRGAARGAPALPQLDLLAFSYGDAESRARGSCDDTPGACAAS
jgi:pimeloyl-ACP methyl ester carboxylesterase